MRAYMFLARKNVIVRSVLIEVEHHGTDLYPKPIDTCNTLHPPGFPSRHFASES